MAGLSDGWVSGIADNGLMFDTVQTISDFTVKLFLGFFHLNLKRTAMNMNIAIEPLLALVIGILILLV
ncbi:MAG: hypothetical protein PHD43_17040, partial [Methylococcales bacterium]|nr:hypothetical protein [Methylococcales bacterium]